MQLSLDFSSNRSSLSLPCVCVCVRFGVSHTSESSSRSSLENGGRERDRGSGSDEDDDSRQCASDPGSLEESKDNTPSTPCSQSAICKLCLLPIFTQSITVIMNGFHFAKTIIVDFFHLTMLSCEGPSWTASFGEAGGNSSSPGPAGWDSPGGCGGDKQEAGWANFTEFQPFSRWEPNTLHTILYTFDVSVWDIVTCQFINMFLVRPF